MKEHTLRLCLLFSLLALLCPVEATRASTQFSGLYRYEVDPDVGTNVHDARIEVDPSGGEAYTGDNAVSALVWMNGYADGDWKRVKFFDPDQVVVFDRITTFDGSTNCFVYQTFHAPAGTSQTCLTEEHNSAGFYSVTGKIHDGKTGTWSFEVTGSDGYRFAGSFELVGRTLEIVGESHYRVEAQSSLAEPLQVRLLDYDGVTPVEGEPVSFTLISTPGGAVGSGSETQTTDAAGIAQTFFDAGVTVGTYVIEARSPSAPDFPQSFTVEVTPAPYNPLAELDVAKNLGNPEQCEASLRNPINVITGGKFQAERDYQGTSAVPLAFTRYYNSLGEEVTALGPHWRHSYDRQVRKDPASQGGGLGKTVWVARPDGRTLRFTRQKGQWVGDADITETLVRTADKGVKGWEYHTEDNRIERYDAEGRLSAIVDLSGHTVSLGYDPGGRLSEVSSPSGEQLHFAYDSSDRLERVSDHAGRDWQYRYDGLGRLAEVINPDQTTRRYHYEHPDFPYALTGITDERQVRFATYEYDRQGRAIASWHGEGAGRIDVDYANDGSREVRNGRGEASAYHAFAQQGTGLLGSIQGPGCAACGGTDSNNQFDPVTNDLLRRSEHGTTTEYGHYDAFGHPGYVIEAAGTPEARRTEYVYDPRFRGKPQLVRTTSVYPGGERIETFAYDDQGRTLEHTVSGYDPDGQAITRSYRFEYQGPFGQLSRVDGPRSDVDDSVRYEYYPDDPAEGPNRSRLRRVIDANGLVLRDALQYSATGKVLSERRPNGLAIVNTYYPGNDRLETRTEISDGASRVTRWTYLPTGELETVTTAAGTAAATTLTFAYDAARRLVDIADGLGNRLTYTLDTEGNLLEERTLDADGTLAKLLTRDFDAYNRLDTLQQANELLDVDYAPDGTLQRTENAKGVVTTYAYDALRRRVGEVRDANGIQAWTGYAYDAQDRVIRVTDPNANPTDYTYDDLGNLLVLTSPDTGTEVRRYDPAGNLRQRTDAKGQTSDYDYDAAGRLTQIDLPGTEDDTLYHYDDCPNGQGRLCSVERGATRLSYRYDAWGQIIALTQQIYDLDRPIEASVEVEYDPASRISALVYPSGAKVRYRYDAAGQISSVSLERHGQAIALLTASRYQPFGPVKAATLGNGLDWTQETDLAYRPIELADGSYGAALDYDPAGNLRALQTPEHDQQFEYDGLDRLIGATGAYGHLGYDYDPNGNRLTLTQDSIATDYDYQAGSNRLSGIDSNAVTIDPNGNITAIGDLVLGYTVDNRLQRASGIAEYHYNGLGQRVLKLLTDPSRRGYLYGPERRLLAELDTEGGVVAEHIYLGARPIAVLAHTVGSSRLYYVHADHLGTPRAITDADQTTVWQWHSDPFGTMLAEEDPDGDGIPTTYNLRFPGQYFDAETGLHYNYFRDYDPKAGRYITSDPVGFRGGPNTYGYVSSNPLRYIDPQGLSGVSAIIYNTIRPMTGQTAQEAAVSGMIADSLMSGAITAVGPDLSMPDDVDVVLDAIQTVGGAQTVSLSTVITTGIYGCGATVTSISAAAVLPVTLAGIGGAEVGLGIAGLIEYFTGDSMGGWVFEWTRDDVGF